MASLQLGLVVKQNQFLYAAEHPPFVLHGRRRWFQEQPNKPSRGGLLVPPKSISLILSFALSTLKPFASANAQDTRDFRRFP